MNYVGNVLWEPRSQEMTARQCTDDLIDWIFFPPNYRCSVRLLHSFHLQSINWMHWDHHQKMPYLHGTRWSQQNTPWGGTATNCAVTRFDQIFDDDVIYIQSRNDLHRKSLPMFVPRTALRGFAFSVITPFPWTTANGKHHESWILSNWQHVPNGSHNGGKDLITTWMLCYYLNNHRTLQTDQKANGIPTIYRHDLIILVIMEMFKSYIVKDVDCNAWTESNQWDIPWSGKSILNKHDNQQTTRQRLIYDECVDLQSIPTVKQWSSPLHFPMIMTWNLYKNRRKTWKVNLRTS